jgi:hypothetical protein
MPEATLNQTENGLVPQGEGWYVLNAREAKWLHSRGAGSYCGFEGDVRFPELGINLNVMEPGEPIAMYHTENAQEDFLVLSGEALLIVEDEERPLRQWDFFHCPAYTAHTILGATRHASSSRPALASSLRRLGRTASSSSPRWRSGTAPAWSARRPPRTTRTRLSVRWSTARTGKARCRTEAPLLDHPCGSTGHCRRTRGRSRTS